MIWVVFKVNVCLRLGLIGFKVSIEATELVDLWPRAQGVGGGAGVTLVLGQDLEPCGSKSTLNKGGTRKGLGPGEKG